MILNKETLNGYLTYITGFSAVVLGIVSQIFKIFPTEVNLELIFMGFGFVGLRRAIKN